MSAHQPDSPLAFLRTFIATRRQALEQLETALTTVERAFTLNGHAAVIQPAPRPQLGPGHQLDPDPFRIGPAGKRRKGKGPRAVRSSSRRRTLAPGSLPDRILEILTEAGKPVKKAAIIAQAGAKEYHVLLTLKELVADRRILRLGATSSLRYATPQTAKHDEADESDAREGD